MYSTQSGIKRAKKHMNQYLVHDVAERQKEIITEPERKYPQ